MPAPAPARPLDPAHDPVGVIGVGNMGAGMAQRLLDRGWTVAVRDVDPAREAVLASAGARVAASPAALAALCRCVIIAVVDAPQVAEVMSGPEGLLQATNLPHSVLLCPTIGPADTEAFARDLASRGVAWLDAPMSGGPARARDGSMSLMLACADEVLRDHTMLLEALSTRVFRVGRRAGDGARTKLVNNLLAGINLAGAAEALALAETLGLDLATTLDVIEQSSGQSWIGSDRLRRAIAGDYAPRAHTTLLAKDTRLALAAGQAAGFAGELGPVAQRAFARACEAGLADLGDASLLKWWQDRRPAAGE